MRPVVDALEFWPDVQGGPLWTEYGVSVDLDTLPLPGALQERVTAWSRLYGDDKLPTDGPGDEQWLGDGRRLLAELRAVLHGRYEVMVTEPWWGEEPASGLVSRESAPWNGTSVRSGDLVRAWMDWCPPRWAYAVPAGLVGLALVLAIVSSFEPVASSQTLQGLIPWLAAAAVGSLGWIWIKRALNAPADRRPPPT